MRHAVTIAVVFFALASSAQPADIVGRASVIDGDTIEINDERVRLNGIDAPESWQRCKNERGADYRCGKEAAFALDEWLAKFRPTRCVFVGRDRYGRFVGTGHAMDWPRYSDGLYADAQERAKARQLGIWRGMFTEPCVARAERSKRKPSC